MVWAQTYTQHVTRLPTDLCHLSKTAFRFVEYLLNPTWSIIQYPVSKCILFYISKKQCIETTLVTGDYHEGICISQFFPSQLSSVHHCSFILSRFWSNVGMMCWCSSSSSRTSTSVFNLLLHNESSDGLNNQLHTHIGVHRRSCGYHRVWTLFPFLCCIFLRGES